MRHKDHFNQTVRYELVILLAFVMGTLFGIIMFHISTQKPEMETIKPLDTTYTRTVTVQPTREEVIEDWRPL